METESIFQSVKLKKMPNIQINKPLKRKISIVLNNLWKIRHPDKPIPSQQQLAQLNTTLSRIYSITKYPKTCGFPPNISQEVTTARNKFLIRDRDQKILRNSTICFFGLSVGSHAALTWMMESRANVIKISDPDMVDATNLNRLRFGWKNIGQSKVSVVEKQLLEINPDAQIQTLARTDFSKVEKFIKNPPLPSAIVDEIDDIGGKALLRKIAKQLKIPVLMAADVGDNIVLDIERYDHRPIPQPFLGRIAFTESADIAKLSVSEQVRLIIQLVGFDQNSISMLDSLLAVGKTIPTWPQLGATATISGGIITTGLKKILLGEKVLSGRYYFSLDDILVADNNSKITQNNRQKLIGIIKNKYSL